VEESDRSCRPGKRGRYLPIEEATERKHTNTSASRYLRQRARRQRELRRDRRPEDVARYLRQSATISPAAVPPELVAIKPSTPSAEGLGSICRNVPSRLPGLVKPKPPLSSFSPGAQATGWLLLEVHSGFAAI
jgi:hypothetical protein